MKKILILLFFCAIHNNLLLAQNRINTYDISSGDPDTALAIFLWKSSSLNIDLSNHREEYIRWDLEHKKISKLIFCLFKTDSSFQRNVRLLEINRKRMVVYARQIVLQDYHTYNAVSNGMEYEYLLNRKDSIVIPLLKEMLADPQVDSAERKKLKKDLRLYKRS